MDHTEAQTAKSDHEIITA